MTDQLTDQSGRPLIAITGIGVVSSLGRGVEENWAKLAGGTSGIHRIDRFATDGLRTRIAGTVDFMGVEPMIAPELTYALAEAATAEALERAGIADAFGGPLFLAAPPVEMEWRQRFELDAAAGATPDYASMLAAARAEPRQTMYQQTAFGGTAERMQNRFGTRGLPITLSTACASGATAVQLGAEAIRRGDTDRALCVGTDGSVTMEALVRFSLLSALSTQNDAPHKASKPFSKERDGFVMAEGAGALVLEPLGAALERGATVLAILRGCGEKADHFHRTRSSPDGSPIVTAVMRALDDAGLAPDKIGYINAHGTSTPENDRMEYNSLLSVFGERIHDVPISSNKSMIGHTLTAAGAIEAVFSVMTLLNETLPPTINHDTPDPDIRLDVVPNEARAARVDNILSNSFGFGGQNACLVLSRFNG